MEGSTGSSGNVTRFGSFVAAHLANTVAFYQFVTPRFKSDSRNLQVIFTVMLVLVIPEDKAGSNGNDTLVTCYEEGSIKLLRPAQ